MDVLLKEVIDYSETNKISTDLMLWYVKKIIARMKET